MQATSATGARHSGDKQRLLDINVDTRAGDEATPQLQGIEPSATVPNAGSKPKSVKTHTTLPYKKRVLQRNIYAYERLEQADFLSTEYVPPDAQKAKVSRSQAIFGGGKAPLWRTKMDDLNELGSGVTLYFRALKYFSCGFLLISLAMLPTLYICATGKRTPFHDVLSTVAVSIANSGPARVPSCVPNDVRPECTFNASHVLVPLLNSYIDYKYLSVFISLNDLLTVFMFLLLTMYIHDRVKTVTLQVDGSNVQASDYSVLVRGLPADVKEEEVLAHFDKLYDLGNEDWTFEGYWWCCGRKTTKRQLPTIPDAKVHPEETDVSPIPGSKLFRDHLSDSILARGPVMNASNTMNPMYLRTYVADVVLCQPNEKLILMYRKQEKLRAKIRVNRAIMKKNCGATGAGQRTFDKAMARLQVLETKVNRLDEQFGEMYSNQVEAAFVTFNCEESAARCIEDYRDSDSWLGREFQPRPLRFRGNYPLTVCRAPEPTEIIWENLSVTTSQRQVRVGFVYCLMVFILCLSIAATVGVRMGASVFKKTADVTDTQCHADLPTIAYQSAAFPVDVTIQHNTTLGSQHCASGSYWLRYYSPSSGVNGYPENWNASSDDEVRLALNLSTHGLSAPPLPHCISPSDNTMLIVPFSNPTTSYPIKDVISCYCFQQWEASGSFITGYIDMVTTYHNMCASIANRYAFSHLLMLATSIVIVCINIGMSAALRAVTKFERHLSITNELRHLSLKMFVSQFLNTAFMIQVVNSVAPKHAPWWLKSVMRGEDGLLTLGWYKTAGATVTTTMLFQFVAVMVIPTVRYVIRRVMGRLSTRGAVIQAQLDVAMEPPSHAIAPRLALMLNVVFVTMMFSSALPLLLPIAAFNIGCQFWFDKYTLLRWYRQPPRMSNALLLIVLQLLPVAAVLHLIVAVWVFGESSVLASPSMSFVDLSITHSYQGFLRSWHRSGADVLNLTSKLSRMVVFPSALLLVLLVLGWLLQTAFGKLLLSGLRRCMWACTCGRHCGAQQHRLASKCRPQFTGPYAVQMPSGSKDSIPEHRARQGWRIRRDPTREYGHFVETRVWQSDGKCNGMRHKKNEYMLTWQVIRESSICSYDIFANPMYNVGASAIYHAYLEKLKRQPLTPNTRQRLQDDADWEKTGLQDDIDYGISPSVDNIPASVYSAWYDAAMQQQRQQHDSNGNGGRQSLSMSVGVGVGVGDVMHGEDGGVDDEHEHEHDDHDGVSVDGNGGDENVLAESEWKSQSREGLGEGVVAIPSSQPSVRRSLEEAFTQPHVLAGIRTTPIPDGAVIISIDPEQATTVALHRRRVNSGSAASERVSRKRSLARKGSDLTKHTSAFTPTHPRVSALSGEGLPLSSRNSHSRRSSVVGVV